MPADSPLNDRQKRFCHEYLVDGNGAAAYLRAGYKSTQNAAKVSASTLLGKPEIKAYLDRLKAEQAQKLDFDGMLVLKELGAIAFFNAKEIVKLTIEGITPEKLDELPDVVWSAIASVKHSDHPELGTKTEFTFHSKLTALGKLARYFAVDMNPNELISQVRALGYSVTDEFAEEQDSPPPPPSDDGDV